MSDTSFFASGPVRDEDRYTLLEIFDRADTYARTRLVEVTRTSEQALEAKRKLEHDLAETTRKLQKETDELRTRLAARDETLARLSDDLHRLQSSLSWRITKPLRTLRFAVGALLHPPSGI